MDGCKSERFFNNVIAFVHYGVWNYTTEAKLNHQKTKYKRYPFVNYVLCDFHTIWKGILFEKPKNLGSSVFNYNYVYKKVWPFLVGQKKKIGIMPYLFIVTYDILQTFDFIDQNNLLT